LSKLVSLSTNENRASSPLRDGGSSIGAELPLRVKVDTGCWEGLAGKANAVLVPRWHFGAGSGL
jgi:hypothetical protein